MATSGPLEVQVKEWKEQYQEFNSKSFTSGQTVYLISKGWTGKFEDDFESAGPIDNLDLFTSRTESKGLKSNLRMGYDFDIISKDLWELLRRWYGGGPEVTRRVGYPNSYSAVQVEFRLLKLAISAESSDEDITGVFSKYDSVADMKREICRKMDLDPNDHRILIKQTKKYLRSDQTLGDAGVINNDLLHIEHGEEEKEQDVAMSSQKGEDIGAAAAQSQDTQMRHPSGEKEEAKAEAKAEDKEEDKAEVKEPRRSAGFNSYGYNGRSSYQSDSIQPKIPPGETGLSNLGNTCFMNSSLQCLSNVAPLREYFISGDYKDDINEENPLGARGKLAKEYANVVENMWSGKNRAFEPRYFKYELQKFSPQFSGYAQHDSQEFLICLLDGLHEDLNRIKSKPYIASEETEPERTDDELSKISWERHLARNDSKIVDLFQGQLRSHVKCLKCPRESVTFDPFSFLSVPVPQDRELVIDVNVIPFDHTRAPKVYRVSLGLSAKISSLKTELSKLADISENMLIADVFSKYLYKAFKDNEPADSITSRDAIYAYELLGSSQDYYYIICHNAQAYSSYGSYSQSNRCGDPRVLSLKKDATALDLYKAALNANRNFLSEDLSKKSDEQILCIGAGDNAAKEKEEDGDESNDDRDLPFEIRYSNERGAMGSKEIAISQGEFHISESTYLTLLWKSGQYNDLKNKTQDGAEDGNEDDKRQECSLEQCLDLFSTLEKLDENNLWYCNKCQEHVQATKKVDLWRLPPILIIHLKRFYYRGVHSRAKLDMLVNSPLNGLDLSERLLKENPGVSARYNLFAVSNHMGELSGGHYTAYARKKNGKWLEFDDSHVSNVKEDQVNSKMAYVLFYYRDDLPFFKEEE
eukprot:TRINITY_DN3631_c0_g1_i1.p1 TRINITY_DN3631_c0_g1~~TRINITY_DN3631_c0_g1_i1.p1  ORF type:complete len:920 (+),score=262.23 TRINITY_DN3631_c0_g1_i1:158-2761(+)